LIEKEVIDGDVLRQVLAEHYPGPKLVPGTLVREGRPLADEANAGADADSETGVSERRTEGGSALLR
jgi:hypothetical protein